MNNAQQPIEIARSNVVKVIANSAGGLILAAMVSASAAGSASAQEWVPTAGDEVQTTVYGSPPADLTGMPEGPVIEGFISARRDERMQVTSAEGSNTVVGISEGTEIKSSGGFLGLNRSELDAGSLLNGLPVTVKTVEWGNSLIASQVTLKNRDLKTATMIRRGTEQGFAEQTAATEALRGRMGDIDKYNIKSTTNVYFDTGKWRIAGPAKNQLCAAAAEAEAMDNALLLVVGYTDSTGSQEYNQILSERRAGGVVNYLQQACGWKPWRMLTPTGMAEADPQADNYTYEGRRQNRRVSVNVLVSKGLDGL